MQSLIVRQTGRPLWLRFLTAAILGGFLGIGFWTVPIGADETPAVVATEPFAVVAIASIDGFLNDLDALAELIGQPNYAKFVRGFLSGMNDLRGIDRGRPFGSLMYMPVDGGDGDDVRLLFFFPTTDLDELLKTVRFGESLRLKRDRTTDELILQTDEAELPVMIKHRFAFLGKEQDLREVGQELVDPALVMGGAVGGDDVFMIVRRAGIPSSVFEEVEREIQADAENELVRKDNESDAEYQLRREISTKVFGLISSAVREWHKASAGLSFKAETGALNLNVAMAVEPGGNLAQLLSALPSRGSRFKRIASEPAPLTVSTSFTLPGDACELIQQLLSSIRTSVESELQDADEMVREAALGIVDSIQKTVDGGHIDLFGQLRSPRDDSPGDGRFVLTGGIGIADSDNFADCLSQVLPLVVEAEEIREVQLNVASADGIEIHRMIPTKVRHRDRRLYGENAAIYLAAGRGVLWVAVGEDEALAALETAIGRVSESADAEDCVRQATAGASTESNTEPLLSVTINLSRWARFLDSHKGKKATRLASLMAEAFPDSTGDTARLTIHTTPAGLRMEVDFAEGYSRLLGLAVARRFHKGDQ